jgi:hypothetical protein
VVWVIGQLLISLLDIRFSSEFTFGKYFWFCVHTYGERKSICITKQLLPPVIEFLLKLWFSF